MQDMEPVWRILIFLAPLCPICQNMTFDLRQLEQDYSDRSVEFVGVFPNASTTPAQIASFKETYGLSMNMIQDTAGWAETLGAKWTPEVFVLDQRDSVVYRGRINDRYFAPGKRKPKTKRRDLDAALRDCLAGRPVADPVTDAVGCPIEGVRLTPPQD
ncbi:MAG: redoxin family protein [Flavobacteriales bacterium]